MDDPTSDGLNDDVSNSLDLLDDDLPARKKHRFLQDNDCIAPMVEEAGLRFLMSGIELQCIALADLSSLNEFEDAMIGMLTMFASESCFQEL